MSLRASGSLSPSACSGDMYSGEPVIVPSCVSCGEGSLGGRLGEPEVEQLGHVVDAAAMCREDIPRLDVAMHQSQARALRAARRRFA